MKRFEDTADNLSVIQTCRFQGGATPLIFNQQGNPKGLAESNDLRGASASRAPRQTYGYRERDQEKRKQDLERINQIDQSKIVYVDEAGFDNRDDYRYGYSYKGTRCHALKSGKRVSRISTDCGIEIRKSFCTTDIRRVCEKRSFSSRALDGAIAPSAKTAHSRQRHAKHDFEAIASVLPRRGCTICACGRCTVTYLKRGSEKSLLPQLNSGDIIVIDNATFHKGQSIQEIVQNAECPKGYRFAYEIWYLPPYSPDLNKRCDPAAVSAAKEP